MRRVVCSPPLGKKSLNVIEGIEGLSFGRYELFRSY